MASSPIISWKIDGETMETVTDFILLGSRIIADGDCSHEIKTLASWKKSYEQPSSVQALGRVRLPATPWYAARQASLSITNSRSLPKLMSTESVMPCNHLILCHPLLVLPSNFPSIRVFLVSQIFKSGGQSLGASASASVLMSIQDWFPLGLIGLIFLQSKVLSRVFSNITVRKH